ncbi:MAG: cysteine desulfurase CsdA [Ignavibacteriales bacterium CG12_big_fil_rev_8_21_14_0_65_30_8]|nr:MAG: cysteine desulfurase CsdA [Ignavibacteriales bacterium CG12_big_fil_rev_8_21_14_0_65_30_8]
MLESNIINEKIFDVEKIRNDFPILHQLVHKKPLCYLDNAASTQKPKIVIDSINDFYSTTNSNIHRGVHFLSEKATQKYENTRTTVKNFINAKSEKEIIFTSGTTASINLVAQSFGKKYVNEDDEIIVTYMEHHSNIVPWQILCEEKNVNLRVLPINNNGELILEKFNELITERTKLISVVHVSNSLGTINPIEEIIKIAHQNNIPVLVDAAQSIQHTSIDVQKLDCDFLAYSGHKIYGPTGVGVLFGKEKLLDEMPPFMGGGDMIAKVTFDETTYNELPYKFEAGTGNIAGVIGLGAAIDYVKSIGLEKIHKHENQLLEIATQKVSEIKGLKIIGTAKEKTSVLSFIVENIHPHDIGTFMDFEGVAIRTGHHCTQPVMDFFKIPATSRASFSFYNSLEDIDQFIIALKKTIEALS